MPSIAPLGSHEGGEFLFGTINGSSRIGFVNQPLRTGPRQLRDAVGVDGPIAATGDRKWRTAN
jgi:hypothetical protein